MLGALLAQDLALFVVFFDLMLVPFFFLTGSGAGRTASPATSKLFIYTLVGSLLMLAAAIATGVLSAPERATTDVRRSRDLAQARCSARARRTGSSSCFAAAFLVKMPAFPFHGWMPDGYRDDAAAGARGVLRRRSRRSPPTASCAIVAAAVPGRRRALPEADAADRAAPRSSTARRWRSRRPRRGWSSATRRSPSSASSRSGSSRSTSAGRAGRDAAGGQPRPRRRAAFFIVALLAARAGGSEDIRDMGGIAFRAPVLAALFLIVAFATLAMPGSANFVGEFLILLGVFDAKIVDRDRRLRRRRAGSRLRAAAVHPRDAQPRRAGGRVARDRASPTGSCSCRSCSRSSRSALYPQLALDEGRAAVQSTVARSAAAPAAAQPTGGER